MNDELQGMFERAKELLFELERESRESILNDAISQRARNITHEIFEKVRNILDHSMMLMWKKYFESFLSEQQKKYVRIYFPITNNREAFEISLKNGKMQNMEKTHPELFNYLLRIQPFSSNDYKWLLTLRDLTNIGKHIELASQSQHKTKRVFLQKSGAGTVSWNPSIIKYGNGVKIMGASVDPISQQIIPSPGYIEKTEKYVSIVIDNHQINTLGFCLEAMKKTELIIKDFSTYFE